ncbi:hypothetical protein L915_21798 [Phytophthora nicotianae]|uniref:Uncharacterized protein n=1 Tax=Phytophthora nicotianae TaxID=4792 RepID=W2FJR6_PHYNI|nr:hypothetical protein L915_21798 [Phytophthora nicotianae]
MARLLGLHRCESFEHQIRSQNDRTLYGLCAMRLRCPHGTTRGIKVIQTSLRMTFGSRRDYGFQPRDAAETARRTEQQPLDTYVSGPAAATADEQVLRHTLRERYLTPQVTTPQEYRERLQLQLNRRSVPSMRTIPVVLNPGESQNAYEAQFQNWVELARRLPSYNALRASFSETDICLKRRLRLDFAKS